VPKSSNNNTVLCNNKLKYSCFFPLQYDTSQKRTFLKRSICNTISESDLYIGNIVTVFGRKLKLIEYLNEVTSNSLQKKAER